MFSKFKKHHGKTQSNLSGKDSVTFSSIQGRKLKVFVSVCEELLFSALFVLDL